MQEQYNITINEHPQQFELKLEGDKAYLTYNYHHGDLVLMHTFVPEVLRGKGLANELAHFALEFAKEKNLQVIIYCPFVSAYLKRHLEYNDLVKMNEPRNE